MASWASRTVLAAKRRGDTPKTALPDDIRVCAALVEVNEEIIKTVPTYTDPFLALQQAAGHKYYLSMDGQKQFFSIPLHKDSQEVTAIWLPGGLHCFQRLTMGVKNASSIAQNHYTNALDRYLPEYSKANVWNFQDDLLAGAHTLDELIIHFRNLLGALEKAGITVNPAKVYIGVKECVFYGYTLSRRGMSPAEKNLDPVRKMVAPVDVSGVRSVLGMFNQFWSFFDRYARLVLPITKLTKKGEDFVWSPECESAMQIVRAKILSGDCYLAAPDHRFELCLDTDASDDGGELPLPKPAWGQNGNQTMEQAMGTDDGQGASILQGGCGMDAISRTCPCLRAWISISSPHIHGSPAVDICTQYVRQRTGLSVCFRPPVGHRLHHRVQTRTR